MSCFPKRSFSLLLTLLLCSTPLWAAPKKAPQKDLTELRARIDKLKKEIDSAEENKADVLDELKQSERAISQLNRGLHDLAEDRREASDTLHEAQQESRGLRGRIQSQQALLSKMLVQQYMNGSPDAMRLMLNQQNPNEIARQVEYYGYLSRSRAALIASLRQNLSQAEIAETTVKEKHAEILQIEAQQLSERRALQQEANQHKRALTRLERKIGDRRKQVAQLERDERRLTQLLERLARTVAAEKAARKGRRATPAGGDFTQYRGRLKLPVSGELSNRFGSRRSDTGTTWKGLFIRAATGSPVRALGPGQVVFADWLRGFGNLIIIDHGDGYMSLYGNNEALLKQEGDNVRAGDNIANVGNSGGNPESGLYFEVRYQSRAIDPLQWVGQQAGQRSKR